MTKLTSGEKAFIGLLFTPISINGNSHIAIGGIQGYSYTMSLDLSKITSVNISASGDARSGLTMHWVDAGGNSIKDISYYFGNVQVPSGAKGMLFDTGSITFANVQFTSFTTTDGKVHTADNLNY